MKTPAPKSPAQRTTPKPTGPSDTVYVSNLSYKRDKTGIKNLLARYGKIIYIKIVIDPETEKSKGMAFVKMSSMEEAKAAIAGLNGVVIDGRTLKAKYAVSYAHQPEEGEKYVKQRDFKTAQIAKKERNDKKRKSNPLVFKAPSKKKVAKKTSKKA